MTPKFKLPDAAANFIAGGAATPDKPDANHPWQNEDPRIIRGFQLRLPADLHATLKYFGDTTAGESMHSLLLKTAFELAEKLKKERGLV